MPTKNPKHRKRRINQNRQEKYESKTKKFRVRRRIYISLFIMALITASALIAVLTRNQNFGKNQEVVEEGDIVYFEYKLWVAEEEGSDGLVDKNEEPYEQQILNRTVEQGALMSALYEGLLGMKNGSTTYIEVPASEDPSNDYLKNKNMLIWVHVIEIYKVNSTTTETEE